jgi:hypothetical protein
MPKITLGLAMKRVLRADQNVARFSVVAAFVSEVLPIMLPEEGCEDGSL